MALTAFASDIKTILETDANWASYGPTPDAGDKPTWIELLSEDVLRPADGNIHSVEIDDKGDEGSEEEAVHMLMRTLDVEISMRAEDKDTATNYIFSIRRILHWNSGPSAFYKMLGPPGPVRRGVAAWDQAMTVQCWEMEIM